MGRFAGLQTDKLNMPDRKTERQKDKKNKQNKQNKQNIIY